MSVRASMADLITRTRTLIFDPSPYLNYAPTVFSDQQIQDALDFWREERRWVALRPMPTYTPGGNIQYLDYYHDAQNWEADVQLQDLTYLTITPTLAELITGHWQFATQPNGIGVRATGKTYDLYASAADLLEGWATTIKMSATTMRTADQMISLNEQVTNTLLVAARYRARAFAHSHRLFQGDAAPQEDGGGVTYPSVGGDHT